MPRACAIALICLVAIVSVAVPMVRRGYCDPQPQRAGSANSDYNTKHPEWYRCESDTDCKFVGNTCHGAGVNSTFSDEAQRYYQSLPLYCAELCEVRPGIPGCLQPPAKPVCISNMCQLTR